MREWYENTNGNYVSEDEHGSKTTVCCCSDEKYRGICDGLIMADSFNTPEEAMDAIDNKWTEFISMRSKVTYTPWKSSKKGSHHRIRNGVLICTKQTASGSWYPIFNARTLEGKWFNTEEEAIDFIDGL